MNKIIITAISLFISILTQAEVRYVDQQLTVNCIGNYSIANRDCTANDGNAYTSIAGASIAYGSRTSNSNEAGQ